MFTRTRSYAAVERCPNKQLSSCQIYNVEKRIQEDHLQQLALFSEYGRMALNKEQSLADIGDEAEAGAGDAAATADSGSPSFKSGATVVATAVGIAAKAAANAEARRAAAGGGGARVAAEVRAGVRVGAAAAGGNEAAPVSQDWVERPFQRLEFLVRDWQVRGKGAGRGGAE